MTQQHTLQLRRVSLGYADRSIVSDLNLTVPAGKITAIVGANGSGKSTLLKAMARLLKPHSGLIELDGRPLRSYGGKELARILALLPQNPIAPEGITVSDLVGRGRYPHQGAFARFNARDYAAVAEALQATQLAELAERAVEDLSGGQRQRAWIALALAQATDILLLDEPTTYLDVTHQIEVLDLLTDLNRRRGTTVVMVLHDLNLAARYADVLIALGSGRVHAVGDPHTLLTSELVYEVFGLSCEVVIDSVSGTPLVLPKGRHHSRTLAHEKLEQKQ